MENVNMAIEAAQAASEVATHSSTAGGFVGAASGSIAGGLRAAANWSEANPGLAVGVAAAGVAAVGYIAYRSFFKSEEE